MSIFIGALVWILLSQAAVAQTVNLRYGQAYSAIRSIFSLPVSVAEREGFFRREGLNFRLVVPIPGGSDKMIDALHDDTCDVTHVATPFLIRAALAGRGHRRRIQQPHLQSGGQAGDQKFSRP